MDSSTIITWMIVICLSFIGLIVFSKPIKYILKFLAQAICGILAVVLFNFILSPFGVSLGLNYLNFFLLGVLGLPGFVSLYLISWLA